MLLRVIPKALLQIITFSIISHYYIIIMYYYISINTYYYKFIIASLLHHYYVVLTSITSLLEMVKWCNIDFLISYYYIYKSTITHYCNYYLLLRISDSVTCKYIDHLGEQIEWHYDYGGCSNEREAPRGAPRHPLREERLRRASSWFGVSLREFRTYSTCMQELDSSNVLGPLDHLDFKPDNLLWFRVRRLAADLVQGPNQGRFRKHESGAGWRLWSRFDSDCIGYLWKSFATKFACVRRVSHLQTEKSHRMHSRMWPRRGLNRYETRTLEALLRS